MVAQHFGRWIDLQGLTFSDNGGTWLQALPLGVYDHPVYGQINVTPERVQRFAANVAMKVRGQDLDIDYDHKADTKVAAGWVSDAQARPDGLWIQVDWTPSARQKLQDKEYRYFSPEFLDAWSHPKTGLVHQDVLLGGALTNRPFLKDILPINLSEMVGDNMTNTTIGAGGTPPTDAENMVGLAKLFGLTGQVTSTDILAAATKLSEGAGNQSTGQQASPNAVINVPPVQQTAPPAAQIIQLGDLQYQLVPATQNSGQQQQNTGQQPPANQGTGQQSVGGQLNYGNLLTPVKLDAQLVDDPVALADLVRTQNEKIGLLASAHKLAEAQALVSTAGNGQTALSPVVRDLAIELMVKAPASLSETVEKLLHAVAEGRATVALGELGSARTMNGSSTIKQFSDAITALRKDDDKMTYADAADQISRTNPALATAYREATMAGEVD